MRFEGMLALRYIKEQKRHSALTICSIALALTLMTMLFTCYGTFMKCIRNTNYELQPYHMKFLNITEEQISVLENEKTVASVKSGKSVDNTLTAEIMFKKGSIEDFDMYKIELASKLGIESYEYDIVTDNNIFITNRSLMNFDLIDNTARFNQLQMFCIFFIFVLFIALALRMIIDTAFEISSKERERQFGVLQSIGASPKQIVRMITSEGLILSAVGIPVGIGCGIGVAYLAFKAVLKTKIAEAYLNPEQAERIISFHVSPLMLLVSAVTGLVWVLLSAYGTGMRIIKMSPVEAISSRKNNIKKVKKHTLSGLLFGWTGKLASRNSRRQKKRFIITVISLTLSIALYAGMGSTISTFRSFYEELFTTYMVSDFETKLLTDCTEPLSYKPVIEKLENSGYFDVSADKSFVAKDGDKTAVILYMNRYSYNEQFNGNPPVSYDELTKSGGYIYGTYNKEPDKNRKNAEITVSTYDLDTSKEGYENYAYSYVDLVKNYSEKSVKQMEFKITDTAYLGENEFGEDRYCNYFGTLDMYENGLYKQFGNISDSTFAYCNLKNDKMYYDAVEFLNSDDRIYIFANNFDELRKARTQSSAVQVGAGFITFLIALIAVVNMVNIISTGIINRKSEIASMQSVGMTEGQLYRMTLAECLQYVLLSAVSALILCSLLILGTKMLMDSLELMQNQFSKLITKLSRNIYLRIGQGAAAALLVTLVSSFIPLRKMQKAHLVERIKSVD